MAASPHSIYSCSLLPHAPFLWVHHHEAITLHYIALFFVFFHVCRFFIIMFFILLPRLFTTFVVWHSLIYKKKIMFGIRFCDGWENLASILLFSHRVCFTRPGFAFHVILPEQNTVSKTLIPWLFISLWALEFVILKVLWYKFEYYFKNVKFSRIALISANIHSTQNVLAIFQSFELAKFWHDIEIFSINCFILEDSFSRIMWIMKIIKGNRKCNCMLK